MPDLGAILQELPKLSRADLEQIRARTVFLAGTSTETRPQEQDDWLLDGIAQEMRRRGLLASGHIPTRARPPKTSERAAHVSQYLMEGCDGKIVNGRRMALGALAGRALADYLTRIKVPITVRTMLSNIDKIPLAVDHAYPGYWQSRLLGFVVRAHGV